MTPLPKGTIFIDELFVPDHELDGTIEGLDADMWLKEPAKPLVHPCHCDIVTIMQQGCVCGGE